MSYNNEEELRGVEDEIVMSERSEIKEFDEDTPMKKETTKDYSGFIVNIQGKQYMTVAGRITQFWDISKEMNISSQGPTYGSITTEMTITGTRVVVKATVSIAGHMEATGHASEVIGDGMINKDSAIENTETSAIGRALGNLGIGLIGAGGVASAEEVERAVSYQDKPASQKQKDFIKKLATEQNKPMPDDQWFSELTSAMAKASIDKLLNNNKQPTSHEDMQQYQNIEY